LFFLVTLLLFNEKFELPGKARPVMVAGDPQMRWILRQGEGTMPVWWCITGNAAYPVELPLATRVAAPLPNGRGLLLVEAETCQVLSLDPSGKARLGEKIKLPVKPSPKQPRIDGIFKKSGSRFFLPIFFNNQVLFIEWKETAEVAALLELPTPTSPQPQIQGEQAFRVPNLVGDREGLVWSHGGKALVWNPTHPEKIQVLNPPTLKNMEQAAAFLIEDHLFWLVFGGQRGDLDSFGWKLFDKSYQAVYEGKGILTRFGLVRDQGPPRLMIWTVSQKIRSQLWAAMSGNRTFEGKILLWSEGRWRWHETLEIKMGKGKGESAFEILWDVDVNGDGLNDVVAFDDKNNMRLYPCSSTFSHQKTHLSLNREPEEVLRYQGALFLATSRANGWIVEKVKMP